MSDESKNDDGHFRPLTNGQTEVLRRNLCRFVELPDSIVPLIIIEFFQCGALTVRKQSEVRLAKFYRQLKIILHFQIMAITNPIDKMLKLLHFIRNTGEHGFVKFYYILNEGKI